jgi:hypothetical protein
MTGKRDQRTFVDVDIAPDVFSCAIDGSLSAVETDTDEARDLLRMGVGKLVFGELRFGDAPDGGRQENVSANVA